MKTKYYPLSKGHIQGNTDKNRFDFPNTMLVGLPQIPSTRKTSSDFSKKLMNVRGNSVAPMNSTFYSNKLKFTGPKQESFIKLKKPEIKEHYSQDKNILSKISLKSNVNVTSKSTIETFRNSTVKKPSKTQLPPLIDTSNNTKSETFKASTKSSSKMKCNLLNTIFKYMSSTELEKLRRRILNRDVEKLIIKNLKQIDPENEFNSCFYLNCKEIDSAGRHQNEKRGCITSIMHPFCYENKQILVVAYKSGAISIFNMYRETFEYESKSEITCKQIQHLQYLGPSFPTMFISISNNNQIKVWELFIPKCVKTVWFNDRILCSCFVSTTKLLYFGMQNEGELISLSIGSSYKKGSAYFHEDWIIECISLEKSKIPCLLLASSYDRKIKLINLKTVQGVRTFSIDSVARALYDFSDSEFVSCHDNGSVKLWSYFEHNSLLKTIELVHSSVIYSVAGSESNKVIYVASAKKELIAIDKKRFSISRLKVNSSLARFIFLKGCSDFHFASISSEGEGVTLYGR